MIRSLPLAVLTRRSLAVSTSSFRFSSAGAGRVKVNLRTVDYWKANARLASRRGQHRSPTDERSFQMKEKLGVFFVSMAFLLAGSTAQAQQAKPRLTNCGVVKLIKAELPDTTIVQVIQQSATAFDS